jgi:hypothetical protein
VAFAASLLDEDGGPQRVGLGAAQRLQIDEPDLAASHCSPSAVTRSQRSLVVRRYDPAELDGA